jgi:hypothetical protein
MRTLSRNRNRQIYLFLFVKQITSPLTKILFFLEKHSCFFLDSYPAITLVLMGKNPSSPTAIPPQIIKKDWFFIAYILAEYRVRYNHFYVDCQAANKDMTIIKLVSSPTLGIVLHII